MRKLEGVDDEGLLLRIRNRANRLARLVDLNAPTGIIRNEKVLLDEAFDEWSLRLDEAGDTYEGPPWQGEET